MRNTTSAIPRRSLPTHLTNIKRMRHMSRLHLNFTQRQLQKNIQQTSGDRFRMKNKASHLLVQQDPFDFDTTTPSSSPSSAAVSPLIFPVPSSHESAILCHDHLYELQSLSVTNVCSVCSTASYSRGYPSLRTGSEEIKPSWTLAVPLVSSSIEGASPTPSLKTTSTSKRGTNLPRETTPSQI